ncbi:unnamed protein product, partial [Closterium sp. NIES-53]
MVLDLPGFYYDEATNRYFRLPRPAAPPPSPSPLAAAAGVHAAGGRGGGGRGGERGEGRGGRGGCGGGVGRGGSGDGGRGGGRGSGWERSGGEGDRHGSAHLPSLKSAEKLPSVFQLLREREAGGRCWHPLVLSHSLTAQSSTEHGARSQRAECSLESQPSGERRRRRKRGKEHAEGGQQQQDGSLRPCAERSCDQRSSRGDAIGGDEDYGGDDNRASNGRAGSGDSGCGGRGSRGGRLKAVPLVCGHGFETAARTAGMRNLKMWQYELTERVCDAGMAMMHVVAQGEEGAHVRTGMLVGHRLGDVSLLELTDQKGIPAATRPTTYEHHTPLLLSTGSSISRSGQQIATYDLPRPTPPPAFTSSHSLFLGSDVTSIRRLPWGSRAAGDAAAAGSRAVITTLGTGGHPARVLLAALDLAGSSGAATAGGDAAGANAAGRRRSSRQHLHWRRERQFVLPGSVWACECSPKQGEIGVGTSLGLQLLHVETGQRTALCHSNSDVLALQVTGEGSIYLAGFRNGAIATIDTREPLPTSSKQLPPPPLSPSSSSTDPMQPAHRSGGQGGGRRGRKGGREWGKKSAAREVKEYYCSHERVMRMPSAVSGMQAMKQGAFYLFASSFDGS